MAVDNKYESIIQEMGNQDFETIRYASYRTACKLQFIQKRTNFYFIDLWNTIEAIRENGLQVYQDVSAEMPVSKLKALISSIFYQLNKRLPTSQHVNIDESITSLMSLLVAAYDPRNVGKLRVFPIKVALSTLCFGNLFDKVKYVYSLISDLSTGFMIVSRFMAFVRDLMALPYVVSESSSYQYDENLPSTLLDFSHPVDLEIFMELFVSPNGPPPCLSWYVILQKMSEVENIVHYTQCSACNRSNFTGFRYKCQKCSNYNLCQDCFWRGRSSGTHNSDTHLCKECTLWKSPSKRLGDSLRKSFRCLPSKERMYFSDDLGLNRRLNLSSVVPASPGHSLANGYRGIPGDYSYEDEGSNDPCWSGRFPRPSPGYMDNFNEEHYLIARYASKLANHEPDNSDFSLDQEKEMMAEIGQQKQIIAQLESKNREIMREISRLRYNQGSGEDYYNSRLYDSHHEYTRDSESLEELSALRARKQELETQLAALSHNRKELTAQLESVMQYLRSQGLSNPSSASSSLSRSGNYHHLTSTYTDPAELDGLISRDSTLDRNLLETADSLSNAMSSMVNDLHLDDDKTFMNRIALADNLEKHLRLKETNKYASEVDNEFIHSTHHRPLKTKDGRLKRSTRRPRVMGKGSFDLEEENIYAITSEDELEDDTEDEIYPKRDNMADYTTKK